jgi:CheY-like chemotaxis protein
LRALSHSLATVPVIAVTANAFEDDRKAALQSGMDDLLAKPFSLNDLERVLLRWTRTRGIRSTSPGPTSSRAPDPAARLVSSGMSMYPKALQNIALLLGVEVDGSSLDGPVSGFLGQWEQRHAMMRQAIEAGDTTTLRQVLHALEGGIPYFGSEKLNAALKELQRHSRAGDMLNAAQACEVLAAHVSELTESRARHLAQTAPTRH